MASLRWGDVLIFFFLTSTGGQGPELGHFNSQAEGPNSLKQAFTCDYNNKSNGKQVKEIIPTWSQNWLLAARREREEGREGGQRAGEGDKNIENKTPNMQYHLLAAVFPYTLFFSHRQCQNLTNNSSIINCFQIKPTYCIHLLVPHTQVRYTLLCQVKMNLILSNLSSKDVYHK